MMREAAVAFSAGLLSFATYFLCKNPQVLAKARAERGGNAK